MKVSAHPRFQPLRRRLQAKPELLQSWRGAAYRVTTLEYPNAQSILMGQGSFLHGGRWNARGSFRAVYGSTEDTVAVAESRATADYLQIPMPFPTPRLLVAIKLRLHFVLDLGSPKVREELGVSEEELNAEDWRKVQEEGRESFTQAIGLAVFAENGEGLLVSSARVAHGINVVYLPQNCRYDSEVKVLEAEKLDRVRLSE